VRYSGEGHVLTCAPTGAGKGTCVVIPNLLVYSGSVFVNDIKGENYQITAQRRREMGQNIIRLDPFAVVDEYTHTMNWMDCLLPDDPNLVAMAQKITDMIIVKDPKSDSHWDNAATALLKGLILHVACYEASRAHSRTMVEVRRLTVLSAKEFKKILYEMQSTEGANGVIKNVANMMLQKSDREFAAVMSTVHHLTDFLDDPRIQKLLGPSTVDWQAIATQPTTVYFIIPPDKLTSYLGLVRSTIVLFMQAASSLSRKVGEERTLFMLDEFSQLGYMQPVEDAISLIRGYGVTLWLLVQDLSQIEAVYPKWKSLLSNVQFFQVFGTNDQFTAEYVSNLLGAATVKAEVTSDKVLPIEMERNLVGDNLVKRALLTPDEVRKMGANGQLIFMQGQYPMFIWKLNYLRDKLLQRFLQDYHVSNKVA
jgi:type IV secretion system protein VirD4